VFLRTSSLSWSLIRITSTVNQNEFNILLIPDRFIKVVSDIYAPTFMVYLPVINVVQVLKTSYFKAPDFKRKHNYG
jgi:hypothetical protein